MWSQSGVVKELECKYVSDLRERREILAIGGDKGYPYIEFQSLSNFKLLITMSATKEQGFDKKIRQSRKWLEFRKDLAPVRSVVERTIRRLKLFGRLGGSNNQVNQNKILWNAVIFTAGWTNECMDLGEVILVNDETIE